MFWRPAQVYQDTVSVSLHPPKDPLFIVWCQLDPLACFCWVDYDNFDGVCMGWGEGGHYCVSKIKLPTCTNWLLIQFGRQTRKGRLFSDKKHDYKVWLTSHRWNTPHTHSLLSKTFTLWDFLLFLSSFKKLHFHLNSTLKWKRRKHRWRPCALFKARHASSTTLRASPKLEPQPPTHVRGVNTHQAHVRHGGANGGPCRGDGANNAQRLFPMLLTPL